MTNRASRYTISRRRNSNASADVHKNTRPKVMLPVANKPILDHFIIELKKAVNEVCLLVSYRDETIRQHFGDGSRPGVNIRYVTQRKQLGTTNALK